MHTQPTALRRGRLTVLPGGAQPLTQVDYDEQMIAAWSKLGVACAQIIDDMPRGPERAEWMLMLHAFQAAAREPQTFPRGTV